MAEKVLEPLREIAGHPDLMTARKGAARMLACRLADGGWAVYSPVPEPGADVLASARALGGVSAVIAPSPFHHLGVTDWLETFPNATLHAPAGAVSRLEKRVGKTPLSAMPRLADTVAILQPAGLKAPEVWLRSQSEAETVWAVCDAFAGPPGPDSEPAEEPKLRGAFRTMCLGEVAEYRSWVIRQIETDLPVQLYPAHGNRVVSPHLPARLEEVLERL